MHMDVLDGQTAAAPEQKSRATGKQARDKGRSSEQPSRKRTALSKRIEKATLQAAGKAAAAQAADASGAAVTVLDDDDDDFA